MAERGLGMARRGLAGRGRDRFFDRESEASARKGRQGPLVREGLMIERVSFRYDVERYGEALEEVVKTAQFTAPVVVNGKRILRTRAKCDCPWSVVGVADVDEELCAAWELAQKLLIVSARLEWEARTVAGDFHGDGIVTRKRTFQKFFAQDELRDWIQSTTARSCVAAAPGIYYVFRETANEQTFLAGRLTRPRRLPTIQLSEKAFEQRQDCWSGDAWAACRGACAVDRLGIRRSPGGPWVAAIVLSV